MAKNKVKRALWIGWVLLSIALCAHFGHAMFVSSDKSQLLIGEATYGHYQIEMACETCHSAAFGGKEVLQNACMNCHAEELKAALDSHPKKKFTDPREAHRINVLDARYCISCHTEHQQERTHAMGVTLPNDFCWHCHNNIGEERASHKGLTFDTCGSAGCHNFHDNRALYENFLLTNSNQPWLKAVPELVFTKKTVDAQVFPLTRETSNFTKEITLHPEPAKLWESDIHAVSGVDCGGCHQAGNNTEWISQPDHTQCEACHKNIVETYTQGKHGMRLAGTLSTSFKAITPTDSKAENLRFRHENLDTHQSCQSCHIPHNNDNQFAATDACLSCHNDDHSIAFTTSSHGKLWDAYQRKEINENRAVSCATCHLPRIEKGGGNNKTTFVNHNQNDNLRPNEKMIRSVCLNCHGLEFSINALADNDLVQSNFNAQPSVHIPSIDWALKREEE